ncbi:MAG: exodeoxyribonuclease VII large subunit [Pseudomonadota bacterium]
MAERSGAPARPNITEYTVTELSGAVKRSLEDGFGYVRVRGELGRVTRAASGHVYLDLKDDRAVLSSVMWKGTASRLSMTPEQGMEVIASGKISTFPGQSRYQLIIDSLEPAGVGALMALLEERKKKLAAEGLFDPERKKAIPYLPEVIGVVTSPSGAVIRDILHRLRDRFPRHVLVWPTVVQGRGAEEKIAAAINGFNRIKDGDAVPRPDVLIVARGGGSLEDLWCFNEEVVVRAAAGSEIPLISAVGHETDTTLIDYASDRRAPTPTAAAEMAVPVRSELLADLLNKARRLVTGEARIVENARVSLRAAVRGLGRPEDLLSGSAQKIDRASERLTSALQTQSNHANAKMAAIAARLGPQILTASGRMNAERLARQSARLVQALRVRRNMGANALVARRLSSAPLVNLMASCRRDLTRSGDQLALVAARDLARRQERVLRASRLLETLSHRSALARGFALARNRDGKVIRSRKTLSPGEPFTLAFSDGELFAIAQNESEDRPATMGASHSRAIKKLSDKKKPPDSPQKSLFD